MDLIASQLAHALDGSTIDYLTSHAIPGTGIQVLVFAGSRIVRARLADYPHPPSTSRKRPSTRIFNTDQIESVELTTVPILLDEEISEVLTVIVGIAHERYTLPADKYLATSANVEQLGAYLPALLGRFAPVH